MKAPLHGAPGRSKILEALLGFIGHPDIGRGVHFKYLKCIGCEVKGVP